jgi:L-arabinose isomerase
MNSIFTNLKFPVKFIKKVKLIENENNGKNISRICNKNNLCLNLIIFYFHLFRLYFARIWIGHRYKFWAI